jgi:hypothetical protein
MQNLFLLIERMVLYCVPFLCVHRAFLFSELASLGPRPGGGFGDMDSLGSNDTSSYTLEILDGYKSRGKLPQNAPFRDPMNWKAKLSEGANVVTRDIDSATRLGQGFTSALLNNEKTISKAYLTTGASLGDLNRDPMKDAIAELVLLKTRQDSVRDFLGQCGNSALSGPWSKKSKR